jgi:hypothetical protein
MTRAQAKTEIDIQHDSHHPDYTEYTAERRLRRLRLMTRHKNNNDFLFISNSDIATIEGTR